MNQIIEGDIQTAYELNNLIPEFEKKTLRAEFDKRLSSNNSKVFVAQIEGEYVGYVAAYDRYNDGSYYCWMAAVLPEYRRNGVLTNMMDTLESWAKENGYNKIKIKTRNDRKEMQHYLISKGYEFTEVVAKDNRADNRLHLEKDL